MRKLMNIRAGNPKILCKAENNEMRGEVSVADSGSDRGAADSPQTRLHTHLNFTQLRRYEWHFLRFLLYTPFDRHV